MVRFRVPSEIETKAKAPVYQLKVVLRYTEPAIWRRLGVPASIRLPQLHEVLQRSMSWRNCHMHAFRMAKDTYMIPFPGSEEMSGPGGRSHDERRFTLADLVQRPRQKLEYEYDFGDGWVHDLTLEKVLPPEAGPARAVCLAGGNAAPPDDCGGPPGYERMLEVLADPDHPEHADMREWIGGPFDPRAFDPAAVNRALQKIKRL